MRAAESTLIEHRNTRAEYELLRHDVDQIKLNIVLTTDTIEGWKKLLWAIGTAAFSGLGLWLWKVFEPTLGD